MKKTPWFPPHIKPVHVGWYECRVTASSFTHRAYWDGNVWKISAATGPSWAYIYQERHWRGRTEK